MCVMFWPAEELLAYQKRTAARTESCRRSNETEKVVKGPYKRTCLVIRGTVQQARFSNLQKCNSERKTSPALSFWKEILLQCVGEFISPGIKRRCETESQLLFGRWFSLSRESHAWILRQWSTVIHISDFPIRGSGLKSGGELLSTESSFFTTKCLHDFAWRSVSVGVKQFGFS